MKADTWDAFGITSALALGAGIWNVAGMAWALILWGSLGLMVYVLAEVRQAGRRGL